MLGKLIPIVIALVGLGAGVGAGIALRPAPAPMSEEMEADQGQEQAKSEQIERIEVQPDRRDSEFVSLSNQFVFPLVDGGRVAALVVLSLTLEVAPDQTDAVYIREPKLRDGFLRVLLDHANTGGFDGAFTSNETMGALRRALVEKGREDLGAALYDVLILDINRQDS